SIEAHERERGLWLLMRYDVELFSENTVQRMGLQLEELLQRITEDADQPIAHLMQISKQERKEIEGWNRTEKEYRSGCSVHEIFEEQARRVGAGTAVMARGKNGLEQISYAE